MQRREFLQKTAAAAVTAPGAVTLSSAAAAPARTFKLKYAPHFGMFKVSGGGDLFDELRFMADAGFRALEDNGMMARSDRRAAADRRHAREDGHDHGRVRHRCR